MKEQAPAITIAMVDDHELFLESMVDLLRLLGFGVVAQSTTAEGLYAALETLPMQPAVALVDLSMNGENGFTVLEQLAQRWPGIRPVVLTGYTEGPLVAAAIERGARCVISKDSDRQELARVIRAVARHGTCETEAMHGASAWDAVQQRARTLGVPMRELEYVQLLNAPGDLTYARIADRMGVTVNTVDDYKRWFAQHLRLQSRGAIVRWALEHQLLLPETVDAHLSFVASRASAALLAAITRPPPPARE